MYKVKSRYNTYYEGDDAEVAYQTFQELRQGGKVVKMTPNLYSKGISADFREVADGVMFNNDYMAMRVAEYLMGQKLPIERDGKKIRVLNNKYLGKVVYLIENMLENAEGLSHITKNNGGITNDIKKYVINLEGGKRMVIFALSEANAKAEVRERTDKDILNIKQV